MFSKALNAVLVLGAAGFSNTVIAHEQYEYYVTGHNHYGEAVYFSCNGGTPREIHNDASRTINLHGGENVHVNCVATHDGEVVWRETLHMSHHEPSATLNITQNGSDGDHN
jgi:hypothetical protein